MQCIVCQPSCILHFFQTCGRLDCHALFEVAFWTGQLTTGTRPIGKTTSKCIIICKRLDALCIENATWIFGPESSRKYFQLLVFLVSLIIFEGSPTGVRFCMASSIAWQGSNRCAFLRCGGGYGGYGAI